MVANGLFMSYLTYLILLYGGCPEYLLPADPSESSSQACHKVKLVYSLSTDAPTLMMVECMPDDIGFQNQNESKPVYLHRQVSAQFSFNTRLAVSHGIRGTRHTQSEIGRKSFFPRTINQWNSLPADVRSAPSLRQFYI